MVVILRSCIRLLLMISEIAVIYSLMCIIFSINIDIAELNMHINRKRERER